MWRWRFVLIVIVSQVDSDGFPVIQPDVRRGLIRVFLVRRSSFALEHRTFYDAGTLSWLFLATYIYQTFHTYPVLGDADPMVRDALNRRDPPISGAWGGGEMASIQDENPMMEGSIAR